MSFTMVASGLRRRYALVQPDHIWQVLAMQQELADTKAASSTDPRIADAVRRIADGIQPRAILVFGSRARGLARPDSDLDLLVVADVDGPGRPTWDETYLRIMQLLWGVRMPIDVVLCAAAEFERWRTTRNHVYGQAARDGWVAYGRI